MTEPTLRSPWDPEFNTTIHTLFNTLMPKGYKRVEKKVYQTLSAWDDFDENDGRPSVPRTEHPGLSSFQDAEIDQEFGALVAHFLFTGPIAEEHREHKPGICPFMVMGAADAFCEAIVKVYGDTERTQPWRKAIYHLIPGLIAYGMLFGQTPRDKLNYLTTTMSQSPADLANVRSMTERVYALVIASTMAALEDTPKPTIH
jgi:hypothetical protein